MKNFTAIIFALAMLTACDNSKSVHEQQRIQQVHDDSVKQAAINDIQHQEKLKADQQALEQKQKQERDTRETDKVGMLRMVGAMEAQMSGLKQNLSEAESFHLLRSSSEKAADITRVQYAINELQVTIDLWNEQIQLLEKGGEYHVPNRTPKK